MTKGEPGTVDQIPWGSPSLVEGFWWHSSTMPEEAEKLPRRLDPLAGLPDALIAAGKPAVREWLGGALQQLFSAGEAYRQTAGRNGARDVVKYLRQGRIELRDPVEPDRPPEYDWNTFRVTAVIYSRERRRGPVLVPSLQTLPNRNTVLHGCTGFDDNEYPALVHPTSELAAWIGGGEGIGHVSHLQLAEWAGQLVQDEASRVRRRKKIDVAT